ncbi:MAG: transcriptional regulator [Acidimicrobiales bacterium]
MSVASSGSRRQGQEPVHPATALHEVVHQRSRLGILAVLAECGRADFPYLKSILHLTDGNLGRHLEILAADGLITITKGYEGRRPRTWAEITKAGQSALAAQVAAMRELVERFDQSTARRGQARPLRAARLGLAVPGRPTS